MDTQLDSIETIMKPTKQYRGFFLFCYFIIIVAELATGYQLYRVAEAYSVLPLRGLQKGIHHRQGRLDHP